MDVGPQASGIAEAAMNAAFGVGGWANLKLKDDGWDAKAISEAANNRYAGSIPDSVYIVDIGTEKVLGDVQNCATSLSEFLSAISNNDMVGAVGKLQNHLGDEVVNGILADAGYTAEDNYAGISSEVLANAAVFGVADNVKNNQQDIIMGFANTSILTNPPSPVNVDLMNAANWYAAAEAFVAYMNDDECTEIFESIDMTGDAASIVVSMSNANNAILAKIASNQSLQQKQSAYFTAPEGGKSQAQMDGEAYVGVMSTVNNLQDDYTKDKDAMKDSELFTDGVIKDRVDSFVAATELVKELDTGSLALLQGLTGSAVVVSIEEDGTLKIIANNQ